MAQEVHDILEKLRKLKNLAEGAAAVGSIEEAANAAARYQEILLKHNLDEQQVYNHSINHNLDMIEGILDCTQYRIMRKNVWADKLIAVVAQSCMCRTVNLRYGNADKKSIIGEKQNVQAAFYMIEQLISKTVIAVQMSWAKYDGQESRAAYWNGFLVGCSDAICMRLQAEEKKIVTENKEMGLMVINKRDLATRHMLSIYGNLRSARYQSNGKMGSDGFGDGKRAGENMSMNRGVGGGNRKMLDR